MGAEARLPLAELELLFDLKLTAVEQQALPVYMSLLRKWNRQINLTADSSPEVVLRKHVFEALWAGRRFLCGTRSLADIGSGAGFPGLFLALSRPECRVVLIERQHKRVAFLSEAVRLLGLSTGVFAGLATEYPSWHGVGLASVRAVRLNAAILRPLEEAGVPLLWFHTRRTAAPAHPWRQAFTEAVPTSEHRLVTRLEVDRSQCFT